MAHIYFSFVIYDFDLCNHSVTICNQDESDRGGVACRLEIIFYFGTTESLVKTTDGEESRLSTLVWWSAAHHEFIDFKIIVN
jgi:hypothetical protein